MSPAAQHALNALLTAAVTSALGYVGVVQPSSGAKEAQWECCSLARELVKECRP